LEKPATQKNLETEQLQKKIEGYEVKIDRLMKVFKKQMADARETSYQLFGYSIDLGDMDQSGVIYKLKSMYAENDRDLLIFKSTSQGIEMLETEFSRTLAKEIHAYLSKCHSIPAFLSNITLELFSRKTFAIK